MGCVIIVTIKDVAKKANVSVNTVSRVLNNRGYISEKTRENVLKAIEDLNYIPNQIARNLYKNKTNLIGVVIPDINHPFFSKITKYIERDLYKKNYKIILCNATDSSQKERDYLKMLQENKVDGIIIGSHTLDTEFYKEIRAPIVALDRYLSDTIPVISSNHAQGGRLAAEKLVANGCKNVLQIIGSTKVNTPSNDRYLAFDQVMEENGIASNRFELEWNQFDYDDYENISEQILDKYPHIDGIFSVDLVSASIIKHALKRKLRIPEDLKVIGYDGTDIAKIVNPSLTTIKQPFEAISYQTVEILDNLIRKKKNIPMNTMVDVQLIEGQTTY